MPVAADSDIRLEPSLEEARELARQGNVVPVRARLVDDCETPVSAFLKLRAGEPEGAVAARLRDYRPAPVEGLPPFAGGAVGFFAYDLVRTVEPLGDPNPDTLGLPDMALMVTDAMVVFDHLRHELT